MVTRVVLGAAVIMLAIILDFPISAGLRKLGFPTNP